MWNNQENTVLHSTQGKL